MTTYLMMIILSSAISFTPTHAQEMKLDIGDPAPKFTSITDQGQVWRSTDHVGDNLLVVFFYPAAMTGGCTAQACSFRDNRTRLTEMGAEVVGISGDRVENLELFRHANNLNFPLLSDSDGNIARSFGVPVRDGGSITREVDGKEYVLTRDISTARWTFIIDTDGNIAYIDTEVDAAGDSEAVIAAITEMETQ
ncbi:MAG: peroxiredoxin [Balneolales bacterium]